MNVKTRNLKVISVCSECGEPVCATTKDKAFRHGFQRFRKRRLSIMERIDTYNFSQEDNKPCVGSGKEVVYKRFKK